jgi:isoleucyl-tRNA synthetase
LKNNEQIRWVPENIKEGRFGKWLDRGEGLGYFPQPFLGCTHSDLAMSGLGEKVCIGSIEELKQLAVKNMI